MNHSPFTILGNYYWKDDLQICVTRQREGFSLPMHAHDFIEINYIAEGKGYHFIGNERLSVERGEIFILPIGATHVYRPLSSQGDYELTVYNCLFSPDIITKLQVAYPLPHNLVQILSFDTNPYLRLTDQSNEIRSIMERMYREGLLKQLGFEGMLLSSLMQLLLNLFRFEKQEHIHVSTLSQLKPIFEYLSDHYCESITLSTLANIIPVSPSYLQRLFKRATNQTLYEYIQNLRIQKSCDLLCYTDRSIFEISFEVGYRDLKFFHALFKKKTGTSPLQYRKKAIHGSSLVQK